MTVYVHPMARRRPRIAVASLIAALCVHTGDIGAAEWMVELIHCAAARGIDAREADRS